MAKKQILGTGLNGLVGSRLVADFAKNYDFENLDLRDPVRPVNICNLPEVLAVFQASKAKFVVHMAAFTDVSAAWAQRDDKSGLCYQVNVIGTKNIIQACAATNKHLIHISTAYVFDGEKTEPYLETDLMQPIEWYGRTKALAEEAITASKINWTILRIDQPFRSDTFPKTDTLHRIIDGLKSQKLYPQFDNHYFGPTYINDFVKIIEWFFRSGQTGLFHATSGEKWSDYDFAQAINEILQLNGQVQVGDLATYLKTLQRPYQKNTALNCAKLQKLLDFKAKTIRQAIAESEK